MDKPGREQTDSEAIQAEIREELEHHLSLLHEACRRELGQGDSAPSRDEATERKIAELVRRRFGDPVAIQRACLRQRTGVNPMHHNIHRLITAVLALTVIGLLWSSRRARESTTAELSALGLRVEALLRDRSHDGEDLRSVSTARVGDQVRIEGYPDALTGDHGVDVGGAILLSGIGRLPVAGLTPEEIQTLLSEKAEFYFTDVALGVAVFRGGVDDSPTTLARGIWGSD